MPRRFHAVMLATTALMPVGAWLAAANPLGGQVVGGSATISGQGTSTETIIQTSPTAIINWNSFNIAPGEKTVIVEPNSSSISLDRIIGGNPSQIMGSLSSNGIIFLVNPNGVLVGPGGTVNAAGFLATTHGISNSDFLAGRYIFSGPGNPSASIVNLGHITAASGGFAALVAPGVRNAGTITATLGTVGLAASGQGFTLDFYGDKLITLAVNDSVASKVIDLQTGQALTSLVSNSGKIQANGGRVEITAAAARTVVSSVINNTGVIEANSIGSKNGTIVLSAATGSSKPAGAPEQKVVLGGRLSASGKRKGHTGGNIQITGENISLTGAKIDASGNAGGGTVSIGGKGTAATATTVAIDAATVINASATGNGNGGNVTVWSNQLTSVAGLLQATGGTTGGNGGLVETSGGTVNFAGIQVNTSAPAGKTGTWLIDPTNLTVDTAAAATINSNLANTNVTLQTNANGTTSGPGTPSSGPGDIIVAAPISWTSGNALTLNAYNSVIVNAAITLSNGTLNLNAPNAAVQVNATVNVTGSLGAVGINAATSANGPQLSFGSGGNIEYTGTPYMQALSINSVPYTLLFNMSQVQNINTNSTTLSNNYALALPLDATGVSGWVPIGTNGSGTVLNSGNGFNGAFQGLGNTISNLTINLPNTNNVGLFGYVGSSGLVQNLGLTGGSVTGEGQVGALVGTNNGTIAQSFANTPVTGYGDVGGLVGQNNGTISGPAWAVAPGSGTACSAGYTCASGTVTVGSQGEGGGLVGYNSGLIQYAFATGAVGGAAGATPSEVGGLAGYNSGQIANTFATGAVSLNIPDTNSFVSASAGGLVGYNAGGSIANSYAAGPVSVTAGANTNGLNIFAGGLVGENEFYSSSGVIANSYATGTVNVSVAGANANYFSYVYAGGLVGANGFYSSGGSFTNSYATGAVNVSIPGSTTSGYYASAYVGGLVGYNDGPIANSYANGPVTVTSSGNTNSGFNIYAGGLVGVNELYFSPSAITNSYATGAVSVTGTTTSSYYASATVGGLVGYNDGSITNSYATGTVNVSLPGANSNSGISVSAGGLVGNNSSNNSNDYGSITNSYATGAVSVSIPGTITNDSLAFVSVGGLVGSNNASITNSYATGAVTATVSNAGCQVGFFCQLTAAGGLVGANIGSITNSSASGNVMADAASFAGGLVGVNAIGTISNSAASGNVSVGANSQGGGLVGANGEIFGLSGFSGMISNSYATGNVSSTGLNVSLGGLVGFNATGATITNSRASGNVTDTAALTSSSQWLQLGGLVGENDGTIMGQSWNVRPTACTAGFTCATGAVTVGSGGTAGGLVGDNDNGGAITNAFVIGTNVVGALGVGPGNFTTLGGLVGFNGRTSDGITNAFATGTVGGMQGGGLIAGVILAGGLVGSNAGSITQSSASTTVLVGDNSSAGGLVGANAGSISNSTASGNVSAGSSSSAGGLVGWNLAVTVDSSNFVGMISSSSAMGNVTAGMFSQAGGLVGLNSNFNTTASNPTITNSFATGNVSSTALNVSLGGLVGFNATGATISNSRASGNVTDTAAVPVNMTNCSGSGTCDYLNLGGLVGQNQGTIIGQTWANTPTSCTAGFTCTTGIVTVGSLGLAGGLVGENDGTITNAFAIGTQVIGAAGVASSSGAFNNQTTLGGLSGNNNGVITNTFATGTVGGMVVGGQIAGYIQAGGLVGNNHGLITWSTASTTVTAGDNSMAGGLVASNELHTDSNSNGINNTATITNSSATGNVTIGANGLAGGFAAYSSGTFTNATASGNVTAGSNSVLGGFIGTLDIGGTISLSNANGSGSLVTSTGPNSIVGGFVGFNAGTVSNSGSIAGVSGGSDSYIGGFAGVNIGTLTSVTVDPTIAGGSDSFIGGIAGLNLGLIDRGTATDLVITSSTGNSVGGVAGVNGTFNLNGPPPVNLGSSFPSGTITNSTATGTGFASSIGTPTPPSAPPPPAWTSNCNASFCGFFNLGSLDTAPATPSTPSTPPPVPTTATSFAIQQVSQLTVMPPTQSTSTQPVVTPVALGPTSTTGTGTSTGTGGTGTGAQAPRVGGNGAPPGTRLIDMPVIPLPPGTGLPPPNETRFLANELVFQIANTVSADDVEQIARRFRLTVQSSQPLGMLGRTVYTFRLANGVSVRDVIRQMEASKIAAAVQPNYTYGLAQDQPAPAAPADGAAPAAIPPVPETITGDPAQYVIEKFHLGDSHKLTMGDNVIVAIIDSEIDAKHPDLAGVITERYDAGCEAKEPDAHGTGMTGAIASRRNLLGVAPKVKVIAICAFGGDTTAEATSLKIIKGLDYAVSHGARVINMSFAGPRDPALAQALQIAREKGIVLIGAAGNAGPKSPPLYPGADSNVIAVTATDDHDRLFKGANQGKYIAVAAPGVDILVPAPGEGVQLTTGTSVATAHVSGVAALLIAQKPSRTPDEIRSILVSTAKDLGPKGFDTQFGAGLVDPLKALRLLPPPVSMAPAATAVASAH